MGGILHPRLNNHCRKPIVNKYRKGKFKRTLKRESKELEVVKREAVSFGTERQLSIITFNPFGDGSHKRRGSAFRLKGFEATGAFVAFLGPFAGLGGAAAPLGTPSGGLFSKGIEGGLFQLASVGRVRESLPICCPSYTPEMGEVVGRCGGARIEVLPTEDVIITPFTK